VLPLHFKNCALILQFMISNPLDTKDPALRDSALILFITVLIYIPFLGLPCVGGNEPVRLIVAKEMLKTGNMLIPLLHGQPYFLKPPLMNWLITASSSLFGVVNEWTGRLPSVFAMLMTGLSIYFLTRDRLTREARLVAAISTLSMVGLVTKGRTAEIDSLFIFFVLFILLIWIKGYLNHWKPALLWSVSLSLLGIGFLAKGPQIIGYFYITVFAYLLYRKKLSFFFSLSHLFGFLFFMVILGVYLIAVLQWIPFDTYIAMWKDQIMKRTQSQQYSFWGHLVIYPPRMLLEFMPVPLFLLPLLFSRSVRGKSGQILKNDLAIFCLVLLAVNFPLYWLLPGARTRYFLPAAPFVAIITAILFESYQNKEHPEVALFFRRSLQVISWITLGCACIVPVVIISLKLSFSLSIIALLALLVLLSSLIIYRIHSIRLMNIPLLLALIVGLFFLLYTALDTQSDNTKKENDPRRMAREINRLLPDNIDAVYELGYDRFLELTYYLTKDVIQLDDFAQLAALKEKQDIYFIFDTKFLEKRKEEEKNILRQQILWDEVYSKDYVHDKGKIVVGHRTQ
jgi:hypothetical protein